MKVSLSTQKIAKFVAQEDCILYDTLIEIIQALIQVEPLSILPKESHAMKFSEIVDNEFLFKNKAYRVTNTGMAYIDDKEFPSGGFKIEAFSKRNKVWEYLDNVSEFKLMEYFKND